MRNRLKILGAVAVIAAASGCSSSSTTAGAPAGMSAGTGTARTVANAAASTKVGDSVSDGKLAVTVTGVTTVSRVDGKATGKLVLVRLKVKNTGDQARAFSADNQILSSGTAKYDAAKSVTEQIKPGDEVTGTVTFDVPKDFNVGTAALEFHGSALPGSEKVVLLK
jgi:hypothetical protein